MNKIFELEHTKPNLTMATITQRNPKLVTQKKPNEILLYMCKNVTSVCPFRIKFEFAGF